MEEKDVLVALLLTGSVLQWYQFVRFRKEQVLGGSHARVHAIAKLILALLVGYAYEWAPHFTVLFAVLDIRNGLNELAALRSIKSSHSFVVLIGLLILIFGTLLIIQS